MCVHPAFRVTGLTVGLEHTVDSPLCVKCTLFSAPGGLSIVHMLTDSSDLGL